MITVKAIYKPLAMVEGSGVKVQRVFGYNTRFETDPFLLLDLFGSDDPKDFQAGFPDHPHRGIETITYMLQGKITHTDSTGARGTIEPGEVQWMTAGSGIIHSEMPENDTDPLLGIQLWINLPQELKMVKPGYHKLGTEAIPVVETNVSKVKIISGKYRKREGGLTNPLKPVDLFDIKLWPNSVFDEVITPDFRSYKYFLFVYEGQVSIKGYNDSIVAPLGVALSQGHVIQVKAGLKGASFILFGAEPNNEPIAWQGSIVMNTDSEIRKALEEYQNGTFIKKEH